MGHNESCTIISTIESSNEGGDNTFSNCIQEVLIKEKSVRLFGFEISPSGTSELSSSGGSSGGDHESTTTLYTSIRDTTNTSKKKKLLKVGNNKSSTKKFKCQSCLKAFGSSQALGGHQNAHKKQKTMKSNNNKIMIQAASKIKAQHGGESAKTSAWCFDQCIISESQINFSTSDPIWCAKAKAKTKSTHQEYSKTTSSTVFTLTTSCDHITNDLSLVQDSTKTFNKLLDLQLGLSSSLHSNLIYS